jgi:hypothetical protein
LVNTLSVEMEPTGIEILDGIKEAARSVRLSLDLVLTGSYEKNVSVEQTGLGVMAVGVVRENELKIGRSRSGDQIVAIGLPRVGKEVLVAEARGEIADLSDLSTLLRSSLVHEVIPVGSRGIAYEANVLAKSSNLQVSFVEEGKVDLFKSAGPATVLLATIPKSNLPKLRWIIRKPINLVAQLR